MKSLVGIIAEKDNMLARNHRQPAAPAHQRRQQRRFSMEEVMMVLALVAAMSMFAFARFA